MKNLFGVAIITGFLFCQANAQPGVLDPDFGDGGKVTTTLASFSSSGQSVAVQPDGKVVVAGYIWTGSTKQFALARFLPNGKPDESFGGNGYVATPFTEYEIGNDVANAVALQPDGKILVAGYTHNGTEKEFALLRFMPDGNWDYYFGSNGKVTTSFAETGDGVAYALAVQPDGKILAAGYAWNGQNNDLAVARFTSEGSLDPGFGGIGQVLTGVGANNDMAYSVALQPDGKVLLAGSTGNGINTTFLAVRLTANGALDNSFGQNGKIATSLGTGNSEAYSGLVQPDGKILLAGRTINNNEVCLALARYSPAGVLDNTFGQGGKALIDVVPFQHDFGISAALQPDGKILMAGFSLGTNTQFVVVRLGISGNLDNTFGGDGRVTSSIHGIWDEAYAIALQANGNILVAGESYNGSVDEIALIRYTPNGTEDNTFGSGGKVTGNAGIGYDVATCLAVQPDNKVIVAGYSGGEDNLGDYALVRYNNDGSLDESFGQKGIVKTDIAGKHDVISSIATLPDGKLLVAGASKQESTSYFDFSLARYLPDGTLDPSFGLDGVITQSIGPKNAWANSVAIQTDGKIVVAGYTTSSEAYEDFAIARFLPNGQPDGSFGNDGIVTVSISGLNERGESVAIQADGKILIAGYCHFSQDINICLLRLDPDGKLDQSFGSDGKVISPLFYSHAWAMELQPDGKILVTGQYWEDTTPYFVLIRYQKDGTLDNSFGEGGIVSIQIEDKCVGNSIALQSDNKILVSGSLWKELHADFLLFRFLPDGELDDTFGEEGIVVTPFGMTSSYGSSVEVLSNGRIMVGGFSFTVFGQSRFAVARYLSGLSIGTVDFSPGTMNVLIYPNPLQQHATLEYDLPEETDLSIALYDLQGKNLATYLDNERQDAGKHSLEFKLPDGLPQGPYLILFSSERGNLGIQIFKH